MRACVGVKEVGAVAEGDAGLGAGVDDDGDGVVRGVLAAHGPHGEPARRLGVGETLAVDAEVLHHQQGVEQLADPGQLLNVRQSEVLMAEQLGPAGLEGGGDAGERGAGRCVHDDGQGVDEQADHGLGAVEIGGAAGDGGAERHVGAAGQPGQGDAPRRLVDSRRSDLPGRRERGEPFADRGGEPQIELDGLLGHGRARGGRGEERRLGQRGEGIAPGGLGGGPVLGCQPGQEVPVGADRGQGGSGGGLGVLGVGGEQFLAEQRDRPAVQQDVVCRQDEGVVPVSVAQQGEAQQRGPGEVEAVGALLVQDALLLGTLPFGAGGPEVDLPPGHLCRTGDHLDGPVQSFLEERRPQVGVAVQHGAGGAAQGVGVELPVEAEDQTHGVDVEPVGRTGGSSGVGEVRVEEQAFLKGRQGKDVFQAVVRTHRFLQRASSMAVCSGLSGDRPWAGLPVGGSAGPAVGTAVGSGPGAGEVSTARAVSARCQQSARWCAALSSRAAGDQVSRVSSRGPSGVSRVRALISTAWAMARVSSIAPPSTPASGAGAQAAPSPSGDVPNRPRYVERDEGCAGGFRLPWRFRPVPQQAVADAAV
ncbi:hypothetical protein GA0115255_103691, partial [Streptomyces sp. Ncost-T6T-2b]